MFFCFSRADSRTEVHIYLRIATITFTFVHVIHVYDPGAFTYLDVDVSNRFSLQQIFTQSVLFTRTPFQELRSLHTPCLIHPGYLLLLTSTTNSKGSCRLLSAPFRGRLIDAESVDVFQLRSFQRRFAIRNVITTVLIFGSCCTFVFDNYWVKVSMSRMTCLMWKAVQCRVFLFFAVTQETQLTTTGYTNLAWYPKPCFVCVTNPWSEMKPKITFCQHWRRFCKRPPWATGNSVGRSTLVVMSSVRSDRPKSYSFMLV